MIKVGTHTIFNPSGLPGFILQLGFDDPWKIPLENLRRVRYPYCKEVRKYACEEDVKKSNYVTERHR